MRYGGSTVTIPSANSSTEPGDNPEAPTAPRLPRTVVVVGLGNPGPRYARTRHNVGFDLVDLLAARHKVRMDRRACRAVVGSFSLGGHTVLLAKPQTFMNDSGISVAALLKASARGANDLLVLVDDIHLPVGRLRLRERGSAGGQNGMKSIIGALETEAFSRLRIGVGEPPPGQQVEWVLSRFSATDRTTIDDALIEGIAAVESWIEDGAVAAMNRVNAPPDP